MVRQGFIVHPFETGNSKYHASFSPNYNKTNKSFNTLREAKNYLIRSGVKTAMYDSPSGVKNVVLKKKVFSKTIKINRLTKTGRLKKKYKRPYYELYQLPKF